MAHLANWTICSRNEKGFFRQARRASVLIGHYFCHILHRSQLPRRFFTLFCIWSMLEGWKPFEWQSQPIQLFACCICNCGCNWNEAQTRNYFPPNWQVGRHMHCIYAAFLLLTGNKVWFLSCKTAAKTFSHPKKKYTPSCCQLDAKYSLMYAQFNQFLLILGNLSAIFAQF